MIAAYCIYYRRNKSHDCPRAWSHFLKNRLWDRHTQTHADTANGWNTQVRKVTVGTIIHNLRVINYPQGWERGVVEEFWTINVMERWYWCVQQRQHNRRQYRLLTEFGCVGSYWSIGSRCCCEKNKKEIYRDGWKKRNSAVEKQLDWEYGLPSVLRSTMEGRKKWLRRRFWRKRRAEAVDHQNQWQVKILKWGVKSVLLVCGIFAWTTYTFTSRISCYGTATFEATIPSLSNAFLQYSEH